MVRFSDIMKGRKAKEPKGEERPRDEGKHGSPPAKKEEISFSDLKKEKVVPEPPRKETKHEPKAAGNVCTLPSAEGIYNEALLLMRELLVPDGAADKAHEIRRVVWELIKVVSSNEREILSMTQECSPTCYLYCHSLNVVILVIHLGIALNYHRDKLQTLGFAAFLHDIAMGKHFKLVSKKDKLNHAEIKIVQRHSEEGRDIVKSMDLPHKDEIADIIWQVHERINGQGYPRGLKGEEIKDAAKLIGLVDTYETLTHDRPYRDKITPPQVIEMLLEMKDEIFDSDLIRVMIEQFSLYPLGSYVVLNTGEVGKVVGINKEFPTRPKLEVILDSKRKKTGPRAFDLSQAPAIQITGVVDEAQILLGKG